MDKFNGKSSTFKHEGKSHSGIDFEMEYSKLLDSTLDAEKKKELRESRAWKETNRCLWIHLGSSIFFRICTFYILYYYYTRCRLRNTSIHITSLL